MFLSKPFHNETPGDAAASWAVLHERGLRELRMRASRDFAEIDAQEVSLIEAVPARDAGDVCHMCGKVVTWVDHLPPLTADGPVRCFDNVVSIGKANYMIDMMLGYKTREEVLGPPRQRDVEIDDIFRRV